MPQNEQERTPLVGPYTNPLASNQRGRTDIERTYEERNAQNPRGTGAVVGGPRGLNDRGAYWREVQGNELSSNRLEGILNRGGAYIQGARGRAARAIAGRGGFNSNLAIAEAEGAAIERGGEFAMQEAEAFGRAASQNQDAFNQARLAQDQNNTQIAVADIGAGATIGSAQIRASTDLITQDRDQRWRTGERVGEQEYEQGRDQRGYDHESSQNELDRRHQTSEREGTEGFVERRDAAQWLRDWFSDPANADLVGDPTAIAGMHQIIQDILAGRPPRRPGSGTTPAPPPPRPPKRGEATEPTTQNSGVTTAAPPPPGGVTAGRFANRPTGGGSRFDRRPGYRGSRRDFGANTFRQQT